MGVDRQSRNGDGEQTSVLAALRLGGLSTTLSSTFPFEKSKAAEVVSVTKYIKYGFENWDGTQSPCIDPEHSAPMVSLQSFVLQTGPSLRAIDLRAGEQTWDKEECELLNKNERTHSGNYPRLEHKQQANVLFRTQPKIIGNDSMHCFQPINFINSTWST
jgi:hypothetical protein